MRAADVRRADRRTDPALRPLDRAAAVDARRGRPGDGRAGRGPAGRGVRGVGEPEHGAADGRGTSRSGAAERAGGGVDEFATRKGRAYGTALVDAETRRPVDLLPDRETSSLAAWLAERPGVEIVCRDRAPFLAEGVTAGAPQAVQVRTAGTCGTTSARRPNGPSPATDSASAP
ncbi:transposase [Kitasatospora phosalacinea]|uniref:transposase n=1 Tax=Kitasatospora phosalacinea TaxID=2065 RepID=UPI001F40BE2B|nr:transposase [Kitasatospora phosalacinea]